MVQARRNGQIPYHLRTLICGIVCYGAALAPTITSAFGQYDVLREIEAQQRLAGGAGGYPDQQQAYLRRSSDYEDVERLGSYLDEFMGLDQPPAAAAGRRLPAAAAAPVEDQVLLREIEAQVAKIRFPRLTGRQKDFAVHPGYPHYYNHELRQIEDEIEKRKGALSGRSTKPKEEPSDEEVAEDPFEDKSQKGLTKDVTFGTVRQAPEGVIPVSVEKQVEDAILKKADADGGVVITGLRDRDANDGIGDVSFTIIVAVCSAVAAFTIVIAGVIYHRLQKNTKAAEDVEYPAYGVTAAAAGSAGTGGRQDGGSAGTPTSGGSLNGDRKLAQNAQMYHYQHQKQQMIAFESHQNGGNRNRLGSDDNDSDEEEGDYTVYECPGLAPTGEMEVRNPMFSDDQTTPKGNQK